MKRLIVLLALLLTACGEQSVDGAIIGTGISATEVDGYDVVCFIATSAGDVKSIDCLPDKASLREGN